MYYNVRFTHYLSIVQATYLGESKREHREATEDAVVSLSALEGMFFPTAMSAAIPALNIIVLEPALRLTLGVSQFLGDLFSNQRARSGDLNGDAR